VGIAFDVLTSLHLICVVGGFGYLAYSGLTLVLGRRRGAAIGTLEVTQQVGGLAELLIYGAFLFGVAAVGASHRWGFGQAWVIASLVLYVGLVGVLHALIRPGQREYTALARKVAAIEGPVVGTPPEIRRIERLEQRIALGWGMFNVIVLAVIVLMVVKPGS
jgi:uncharacterized membrane protein